MSELNRELNEDEKIPVALCCLMLYPPAVIASKFGLNTPRSSYELVARTGTSLQAQVKHELSEVKFQIEPNEETKETWMYSEVFKHRLELFYCQTKTGNRIVCIHVPWGTLVDQPDNSILPHRKNFTILYSNDSSMDIGRMVDLYVILGAALGCNIFAYDYSGYGKSSGSPSEKNIYADIEAAYNSLLKRRNISPENVILFGSGFGSGPAIDLATRHSIAGLILHTPFKSGMSVIFPSYKSHPCWSWYCDAFVNTAKIPKVKAPVLVVHGNDKERVDITHAKAIYKRCAHPVEPFYIESPTPEFFSREYLDRLIKFITSEIPQPEFG